jgi:capsule polysaccharide export protein KpsE/RkpR
VIGVEFQAPSPQLAAEVANTIAETFVDMQQEGQRETAVAATAWLEQEIERLRERVAEAEQAISEYRANNELFDLDRSGTAQNGSLSTQQLSDLNAELGRARAARAEAEARAQLVQSLLAQGAAIEASEEVVNSQLIQRLRERQVALRTQIAELSTTLLPAHPRIRALESQLANLEPQIRSEAQKILASLNTAARIAAAREQSLLNSMNQAMDAVSETNDQSIELRALEREAAAQRDLLESFLARYREALARTDIEYLPADARIISRAVPPREASYPKKAMMSVAVAIATLLIGSAIVLLREFTSGRAFRIMDYGMVAPLRPGRSTDLVVVPNRVDRAPGAGVVSDADAASAAAFAATAAAMDADMARAGAADADIVGAGVVPVPVGMDADQGGTEELGEIIASPAVRLALFAGARGGEGAGDIAFATARDAAGENLRLVIIDLGRPPSEALGGYQQPGLGDLLAGDAAFGEVIMREEGSRVHVIPMGAMGQNAPLQRLQLVIGALTHTYDKVIAVVDKLADWPHEHFRPDIAAIVCGPDTTDDQRAGAYETALQRGAQSAVIVRYSSDRSDGLETSEAA